MPNNGRLRAGAPDAGGVCGRKGIDWHQRHTSVLTRAHVFYALFHTCAHARMRAGIRARVCLYRCACACLHIRAYFAHARASVCVCVRVLTRIHTLNTHWGAPLRLAATSRTKSQRRPEHQPMATLKRRGKIHVIILCHCRVAHFPRCPRFVCA